MGRAFTVLNHSGVAPSYLGTGSQGARVSGNNPNCPELAKHKNISLPQRTIHVAVEDRYLQRNAGATASSPSPSYPGIQLDLIRVTKRWINGSAIGHGKLDGGSPPADRINQLR